MYVQNKIDIKAKRETKIILANELTTSISSNTFVVQLPPEIQEQWTESLSQLALVFPLQETLLEQAPGMVSYHKHDLLVHSEPVLKAEQAPDLSLHELSKVTLWHVAVSVSHYERVFPEQPASSTSTQTENEKLHPALSHSDFLE